MTDGALPVALRLGFEPTPMQRGLLASQRRHPTSPLQNMALLSHLDGPIDTDRLIRAFDAVVTSSDVLRSRFNDTDGSTLVRVDVAPAPPEIVNIPRSEVHQWASARASIPIDVARRAYDSAIVRHEDGTASWYLALHHSITDATSSMLVFDLTAAAYADEKVEVSDYYDWWRSIEPVQRDRRAEQHWRDRPPAPRAGQLYRPVLRSTPMSFREPVELGPDLRDMVDARLGDDLGSLSDDLGWTILLMTVAAVYLHRLTGTDEMAIGLPVHNRAGAGVRQLIGPLMEVFPVDVSVDPDDTFRTLHRRIRRAVMTTLRHARPGTAPSTPDCEAIVNVITRAGLGHFGDVPAVTEWIHAGASDPNHLFRLQLTNYGEGPGLVLDLNAECCDADHRRRAPDHVRNILSTIVNDPDQRVAAGSMCLPDEFEMLRRWGTGPVAGAVPESIVTQLETVVRETDTVVLECSGTELTGRQLWRRTVSLAEWLRSQGVGSAGSVTRVAIELERGIDAVVAILATLVAGGSYVPLDPEQPLDRRRRLAARAGCVLALDELPQLDQSDELDLGIDIPSPAGDSEAYLLFTSGSTGEPKGVPITHAGLARYVEFARDAYLEPGIVPVAPLFSALSFDLTVTSLFVPLLAGGRLVVIEPDGPSGLAEIARRSDLNWCKATPSHLELLLRLDPACNLRTLIVGGEAFRSRLARRLWKTFPSVRVFNEYGPTEAVVGCMIHEAEPEALVDSADVPIGRPAPGVALRIVDPALNEVPIGVPGELLISHVGLTSGYLPDIAIDDPFVRLDEARWYRSGDLVRLADTSTLVYLGRIDEQIKTGGIRLEPTEVEHALTAHPAIERAAVRLWSPTLSLPSAHCVRCGLPSNVPGIEFDDQGVCATCHSYANIKDQAAEYFGTHDDLVEIRDRARRERTGAYDCLHLLSGGKDSTYALYQLVELGFDVRALTLDNGYISDGAKENVRRSVAELGIDHEFVATEAMDEIFRDSLDAHSNVCHGCYKTLYTLATTRADELGIPVIVTGLSRGQLFETRLVPEQFGAERFDPDAIDRAVVEARRSYHRVADGPNRLLDTSVFDSDSVFERISYVDFYRYADVELAEMLAYLDAKAPWVRPADTGRSTNCLINAAGIHTHLIEQGYHNYAIPYAWDVRLGHKTRQEAIDELDDDLELASITDMLGKVGYTPAPREILTAWYEVAEDANPTSPAELRTFLGGALPAHAIPAAFVAVDEIQMTRNGKLDVAALPEPTRVHRSGPALHVSAETALETTIVEIYERVLGIEPVGVTDDFFDLGGDSLAALGLVVELSARLGRTVREELVFTNTTPRVLAEAIGSFDHDDEGRSITSRPAGTTPRFSSAEQAMLFEHLDAPDDPRFNVGHLFRVHGAVDTSRFVDAFRTVVGLHTPLTWTYADPRRHLSSDEAIDVFVRSIAIAPDDLPVAMRRFHVQPFDLEHGPIGRCVVQPLSDGSVAVLVVVHHIAVDAGSFDRLWSQIDQVYSGAQLELPPVDYADHAAWQQERLTNADLSEWLREPFADELRFERDGESDALGGGYIQRTASFTAEELRTGPGATPFATSLASLAVVLRRRCTGDRVGLGVTISTREHPASDELIGLFLNTVPVAIEVGSKATHESVAAEANAAVVAAMSVRGVPLARIVDARRRAGSSAPPVGVLLAFEDWVPCRLGGVVVDHEVLATGSPVADVTVFVQVHGSRIELSIEHRNAVLDDRAAARLLDELDQTIGASIDRPRAAVSDLETGLSSAVVSGPPLRPDDRPVQALISEHAERDPAHPAVRLDDRIVSYGDLDRRSSQLAHELRSRGARPGQIVGVVAHRVPETVVVILGVLKTGAAYVPIDPDYPAERIRHITADAGLASVITTDAADRIAGAVETLDLDALDLDRWPTTAPDADIDPDHLAYVIYTSGSTGVPKGVMVRHRNIVASTNARSIVYDRPVERFLLLSSFAFDSSMVGLFWTLGTGATLVLPPVGRHDDVLVLDGLIDQQRITHLLALPSLYRLMMSEADDGQLRSLATVIVAGEACSYDVVERHRAVAPGALLVNEYGPTEATVWSHAYTVDAALDSDPVPIGTPIPGGAHLVLDANRRPVASGEPGELLIAGAGVGVGYLGRDDLTAERFVELDPSLTGGVAGPWYRTGDLVRSDVHGRLLFVGRSDEQIKVRGVRIEPAEIAAALRAHPDVSDAVVGLETIGEREQLVGWIVPSGASVEPSSLRAAVSDRLPSQFVPSRFVELRMLPLGPNGKVDRHALPIPDLRASEVSAGEEAIESRPDVGSSGQAAQRLAAIWAEAFGVATVGIDENFFDLGGDSIISLQIVARARRAGIELRPRQVFDHQTVRELISVASVERRPMPDQTRVLGEVALTPIQRWFFEQDLAEPDHWNQTIRLEVDPATDVDRLVEALEVVRGQHDQLRSVYDLDRDSPRQVVVDRGEPVLVRHLELDAGTEADLEASVVDLEGSLDLRRGRLIGVLVCHSGGAPRQLVVTIHHLVVDGVSWSSIIEDWSHAYHSLAERRPPEFSARSTSFRTWANLLTSAADSGRFSSSRPFWSDASAVSAVERSILRSPSNTLGNARSVTASLDRAQTSSLVGITSAHGDDAFTIDDVLVAALAMVGPRRLGHPHLGVMLEGHGREDLVEPGVDLSRTVGWFTTIFPVELRLSDPDDALVTLGEVRGQLRRVPDRGIGFGVDRYLGDADELSSLELPIVAFNYLGQLDRTIRVSAPFTAFGDIRAGIAARNRRTHLLGILAMIRGGQLIITVDHLPEHLDQDVATELAGELAHAIARLTDAASVGRGRADFDLLDQSDADAARLSALLDQFE